MVGVTPSPLSQEGKTPLHLAAMYCRVGTVTELINKGADLDAKDVVSKALVAA